MTQHHRVQVGKSYMYVPVIFDVLNPPFNAVPGDIVEVVNLPGAPRANTMGMCHISKDGKFAGMVMTNSLKPVGERGK